MPPTRARRAPRRALVAGVATLCLAAGCARKGSHDASTGSAGLEAVQLGPEVEINVGRVKSARFEAREPLAARGQGDESSREWRWEPGAGEPPLEISLVGAGLAVRSGRDDAAPRTDGGAAPDGQIDRLEGAIVVEASQGRSETARDTGPAETSSHVLSVTFDDAAKPRKFRGAIVLERDGDAIQVRNRLRLEEYLPGVVGSEMSASVVPIEALKAQAVASRTYALYEFLARGARGRLVRFSSRSSFQAYGGVEKEHPRALEAVRDTVGQVLTYRGGIFRAYFHSSCAGHTVSAAEVFGEPSMEPLDGAACGDCAGSRFERWTACWRAEDLTAALTDWSLKQGIKLGKVVDLEVTESDAWGRPRYVRVRHEGGRFEMTASKLRSLLDGKGDDSVRSVAFTVTRTEKGFLFEGAGWGHGVGMCQVGAARRGEKIAYREVLSGYFPGSAIETMY